MLKKDQEEPEECQFVFNINSYADENYISYYLEDDQGEQVVDLYDMNNIDNNLSFNDTQIILMKWLFYIYDEEHDLVDEHGFSYFVEPLEKLMKLTFKTNNNQPQYKKLKSRLEFLSQ